MYLGEMVGSGTQVFDNIVSRKITAKEIAGFDNIISGVDWGYYPDPWVFIRTYYHAGTRTLYIFDEARGNKLQNDYTARLVKERVAPGELILADLADEKSCADYRSYGLRCWPARKGPGSRELGVRWLQGLNAIVIDPVKCPCVLQEFLEWEYEVAPDGTVLGTLMDANDHGIDAARYACSRIWQRKGRVTNEAEGLAAEEVPAQLGGAGIRRRAGGGAEACAGAGGGKPHAAGIHQRRGARAAGKAAGNSDRKE